MRPSGSLTGRVLPTAAAVMDKPTIYRKPATLRATAFSGSKTYRVTSQSMDATDEGVSSALSVTRCFAGSASQPAACYKSRAELDISYSVPQLPASQDNSST